MIVKVAAEVAPHAAAYEVLVISGGGECSSEAAPAYRRGMQRENAMTDIQLSIEDSCGEDPGGAPT